MTLQAELPFRPCRVDRLISGGNFQENVLEWVTFSPTTSTLSSGVGW